MLLSGVFFASLCREHNHSPDPCPVGSVLAFLQEYFSMDRAAPATLKVYVVAIAPSLVMVLLRLKLGCISKVASPSFCSLDVVAVIFSSIL